MFVIGCSPAAGLPRAKGIATPDSVNYYPRIEPLEARIAPAFAPVFELSSLDGLKGVKINGTESNDKFGYSVGSAGDVNGDGFDDLIIGAFGADPHGSYSGASYVVFGKESGFPSTLNFAALDGVNGFMISGVTIDDGSGGAVKGAGDFNGDGFDDLIIGASGVGTRSGASYVIFGKASGFAPNLNLSTLNGSTGFKLSGVAPGDGSGCSVSAAGDVNGDGCGDVIIGASGAGPNGFYSGASYVVFGKPSVVSANLNLSNLDGSSGFKLSGVTANDHFGTSVSLAGDVNGDGLSDLIIGAPGADPNGSYSGASYVLFGKRSGFTPNVNASDLDGTNGFRISGVAPNDFSGRSVSAAGDINGDGFADVTIGARLADSNGSDSGASYVVFGKKTEFAANLNLSALNGSNGFKVSGVAPRDYSGNSVSAAGDVNGDGFGDLIIGAPRAAPHGIDSGASYVIFGKPSGFTNNINLGTLNGTAGFKLSGVAPGDNSGNSVSAAGDINGDGFGDLIIGAPRATGNRTYSGASYVVFGKGVTLTISDATASEGDVGTTALSFTVSLSEAGTAPITVEVATTNGTALAGSDYVALSKTILTFAPGELTKSVTVDVIGDMLYENGESFSVVLSNAVGGVIKDGTGVGTIANDDAPPVVSVTGGMALEGDSGTSSLVFTVSLSAASGLPATVRYSSADGTAVAGIDYTAPVVGSQITFAPGETTKTITVDVLGDKSVEDHEQFSLALSEAIGASIGTGTATGSILNDDTAIHLNGPGSLLEGNAGTAAAIFTLTLEKASALPVTVSYATVDGTALAGSDFTAPALGAQITFAPGETSKTIAIDVLGDAGVETHENFSVVISGPVNATLENESVAATILNDDTLVGIDDASVLEGHADMHAVTFTVSLAAVTALPVEVKFSSVDGTATAGVDYIAPTPGTISFAPGETTKTITVDVLGDINVEPSEAFSLTLSEGVNAVIDHATGLGTILDDDVTLISKHKATFKDVDGDVVTIKVNKGTLKVEDFTIVPTGQGAQLALVDIRDEAEFAGANLSITAKHASGTPKGARSVDVGYINAIGIDLGDVVVKGDLGQIDAGNEASRKPGLLSLSASSLGRRGIETQLSGGSLVSDITGALKTCTLNDGMQDATLSISGDVGSVMVRGDVLGSVICSDGKIGRVKIAGDLATSALNTAILSARGVLNPASAAEAMAIRSINIGGSVDHALILAGYDRSGTAVNADVAIGEIIVATDWNASSLAAGASAGPDGFFGNEDDGLISNDNPIVAKIASILIKGAATGSSDGTGQYGFVGEQIGAFKSAGVKLALTSGSGTDLAGLPVGGSGNLTAREVA